jgi:hypothetical protein
MHQTSAADPLFAVQPHRNSTSPFDRNDPNAPSQARNGPAGIRCSGPYINCSWLRSRSRKSHEQRDISI